MLLLSTPPRLHRSIHCTRLIVESDSMVAIKFITDEITFVETRFYGSLKLSISLVPLIQFLCCTSVLNTIADSLAKNASQNLVTNNSWL